MQDWAISPTWNFPGHDPTQPLSNMTFLKERTSAALSHVVKDQTEAA
jgi:hypothetical protein